MNTTTEHKGGTLPLDAIDWQRCLMSVLWRLLPAGDKSITLTTQDQVSMVSAFLPGDPTLIVTSSPGGHEITFRVCSIEEAIASAQALGVNVSAPGVSGLQ